jgi:hypothetical protein
MQVQLIQKGMGKQLSASWELLITTNVSEQALTLQDFPNMLTLRN